MILCMIVDVACVLVNYQVTNRNLGSCIFWEASIDISSVVLVDMSVVTWSTLDWYIDWLSDQVIQILDHVSFGKPRLIYCLIEIESKKLNLFSKILTEIDANNIFPYI